METSRTFTQLFLRVERQKNKYISGILFFPRNLHLFIFYNQLIWSLRLGQDYISPGKKNKDPTLLPQKVIEVVLDLLKF